ncbi:MAG: RNA polymerase sigma factor [Leptospiraceae bacterium]|nr:RNA polymerase sigma factor [Leptospiraceae bacterium]
MSETSDKHRIFSEFYLEYYESVYRIVRAKKFPYNTLRDTVSIIFEKAWLDFETFLKNKDIRWLYKIIRNEIRNVTRNKHFKQSLADDIEPYFRPDTTKKPVEEEFIKNETLSVLMNKISNLPARQRETVLLNIQGYSFTESAKILGISVQAVHKLFKKAMIKLLPHIDN